MDVVPDIDELLDQLEASELQEKTNSISCYQHKHGRSSPVVTATVCLTAATAGTTAASTVKATAVVPQRESYQGSVLINNDDVSNSSTKSQQDGTDDAKLMEGSSLQEEIFTTNLIDLSADANVTDSMNNTQNEAVSTSGLTSGNCPEVQCANTETLAVLEEIFSSVEAENCLGEQGCNLAEVTTQQPTCQGDGTTSVAIDNREEAKRTLYDTVPLSSSPTEVDFAEMETYLAECDQMAKTESSEGTDDRSDPWPTNCGDRTSVEINLQKSPLAVRGDKASDGAQDLPEVTNNAMAISNECDGSPKQIKDFDEESSNDACASLEQSESLLPRSSFSDDDNDECVNHGNSESSVCKVNDICDADASLQRTPEVVDEKVASGFNSSSASENKSSGTDVQNYSTAVTEEDNAENTGNSDENHNSNFDEEDSKVCCKIVDADNVPAVSYGHSEKVPTVSEEKAAEEVSPELSEDGASVSAVVSKTDELKLGEETSAEEAEEIGEDSVVEEADESSLALTGTASEVSVVASTHDISAVSTNTQLTESELQLGKVKPEWIADTEMTSCMLCCAKFTFLLRRHHCRSCGRLLCAQCTSYRAFLPYMGEPTKKFKVCGPCSQTLERIQKYEEEKSGERTTDVEVNAGESATTSAASTEVSHRTTKSALKVKSASSEENPDMLTSSSEGGKRSVKFRDGVSPGSVDAETVGTSAGNASSHSSKPKKIRTSVSKRLKELRMEGENVCFLPSELDDCSLYYRTLNGTIEKYDDVETVLDTLNSGEPLIITVTRNLWCKIKLCELSCCHLGKVVCVVSCGMWNVGLDEIFVAYDLRETDDLSVPLEVVHRIYDIYKNALKNQDGGAYSKMGAREAHLRMPNFYSSDQSMKGEFMHRDLLLFRPSVQCFENLLVPEKPFFVGCFLHRSESVWALSIPQRLLYRIGLHASCYPTPIVNIRSREPVYTNITHTTVLKMFCDFKNWAYRLPMLYGSVVSLCDNETRLLIPNFQKEEVKKLITYNKNMFAWALDFNGMADSHLVCEQGEDAVYKTQVFTSGDSYRRVTGASFIVIDGALKGTDVPVNVNVVEDGITIRLRPDAMTSVTEALFSGKGCKVESPTTTLIIDWIDIDSNGFFGELVSPIDKMPLMGKYQYGLSEERILSSLYIIPGVSDWALRLVAVYNCDSGRFSTPLRSSIFAVAEQIAGQISYTLCPFINMLTRRSILELCIRIHITPEEAEYKAAAWDGMENEFAAWTELLDNQMVPYLFNVCSYVSMGFTAEICFALISTCSLP